MGERRLFAESWSFVTSGNNGKEIFSSTGGLQLDSIQG
jgi:hypothetical protein